MLEARFDVGERKINIKILFNNRGGKVIINKSSLGSVQYLDISFLVFLSISYKNRKKKKK